MLNFLYLISSVYVHYLVWAIATSNHHNRKRKLFDIRKQLKIPSVRENDTTPSERAQALLDIKAHDRTGKWGIAQLTSLSTPYPHLLQP